MLFILHLVLLSFKPLSNQLRWGNLTQAALLSTVIQIAKCDQAKLELKDKIAQFGDEVGFQILAPRSFQTDVLSSHFDWLKSYPQSATISEFFHSKVISQKVLLYSWS